MAIEKETPTGDEAARDDIEFLVSSWNRLEVLHTIATEPRTRDELRERTAVSRVTLSRILSDLEARAWVTRTGDGYETTSSGAYLADEVTGLIANVRTLNRLGDAVDWIRLDQFDFDLARLADAEMITATWDDFAAQTRVLTDLVFDCTALRGIGTGMDRAFMLAVAEAALNGDLAVELLFEPRVIDAVNAEPELSRRFRDLADAEGATVYRYQGSDPLMELGLLETAGSADDLVMLCGHYEEGAPPGTVQTADPVVWAWAERYFEERRAKSHQLQAAVFTP